MEIKTANTEYASKELDSICMNEYSQSLEDILYLSLMAQK